MCINIHFKLYMTLFYMIPGVKVGLPTDITAEPREWLLSEYLLLTVGILAFTMQNSSLYVTSMWYCLYLLFMSLFLFMIFWNINQVHLLGGMLKE